MRVTLLSADDVRRALPMDAAVAAMKDAFAALSTDTADMPHRMAVDVPARSATTFIKAASIGGRSLGAKLVSVFPGNPQRGLPLIYGLVVLLDPETGAPAALLDGTFLTAWRTGAGAGAATDLLARPDARVLALFGCGAQAGPQALAVAAVRELAEIRVYARTRASVEAFVEELRPQVEALRPGCRVVAAASPRDAVEGAHVVSTATTSPTPVFDGHDLADGAHVNGVGSYTPEMQEVDAVTVARAQIFVDALEAASEEAGDLIIAAREGHTRPEDWTEIGAVAAGSETGRRDAAAVTFFKSVGVAVQDVAAAAAALEEARSLGLGRSVEL